MSEPINTTGADWPEVYCAECGEACLTRSQLEDGRLVCVICYHRIELGIDHCELCHAMETHGNLLVVVEVEGTDRRVCEYGCDPVAMADAGWLDTHNDDAGCPF